MSAKAKALEIVSHPIGAFVVSIVALFVVGIVFPSVWLEVVSILIAWVVSDTIISWFIDKSNGGIRIRLIDWHFQAHGRVYLAFFVGIIAATLASTVAVNLIKESVGLPSNPNVFLGSLLAAILVYVDLRGRYFET